jgi:RNA recognition motif-containing protein
LKHNSGAGVVCSAEDNGLGGGSAAAGVVGQVPEVHMDQSPAVPIPSSPSRTAQQDGGFTVDTLVVKNIPFHLPDADFIAILVASRSNPSQIVSARSNLLQFIQNTFDAKPKHVRYIYDKAGGGGFKGMAFVKYHRDVNINAIMAALQGLDIMGRKLRIELKRAPAQQTPALSVSYEESPEKLQAQQQARNGRVPHYPPSCRSPSRSSVLTMFFLCSFLFVLSCFLL